MLPVPGMPAALIPPPTLDPPMPDEGIVEATTAEAAVSAAERKAFEKYTCMGSAGIADATLLLGTSSIVLCRKRADIVAVRRLEANCG